MTEAATHQHETRADFRYFHQVALRWNDLDAYRHVNNVRFYTFYDTVIMHYLVVEGGFDLIDGPFVPFTVENLCRFHRPLRYPATVECALRAAHIGNSSIRYELGLFVEGEEPVIATGYFVDIFVDESEQPSRIPDSIRAHLEKLRTD